MARHERITDAELLDYAEGRLSAADRAGLALRLAGDPPLAARYAQVRAQLLKLRALRAALPLDKVPPEWLEILRRPRHA